MSDQIKIIWFSIASLIFVFFIGGYAYTNYKATNELKIIRSDKSLYEREYSFSIGPKNAKVHIVDFFDPACATCAVFEEFIQDIIAKNKGKIRLTYRYAPFHRGSKYSIKVLEAAKKQGKFLEVLKLLYDEQDAWVNNQNKKIFLKLLKGLNLDINKFKSDIKDSKMDKIIAQDLNDAKKLGANKTPFYFINYKPLGTFGFEPLKEMIYSELRK
jgi:protein-disulfide isomerase